MSLSMSGRLLCASTHAYAIRANGAVPDTLPPPSPPRSSLVGYVAPPVGIVSGAGAIDAALVGIAADGIILAFRGTLPITGQDPGQSVLDWVNDLDAPLVAGQHLPGLVHQGFLGSLDALWAPTQAALLNVIAANPVKPLWVTGHSKGGAIANLAAARIRATIPNSNVLVETFAAARPGDAGFAAGYSASVPQSLRYEFADDMVPHLPPGAVLAAGLGNLPVVGAGLQNLTGGFTSVGTLQYIPARAAPGALPLPDSPELEAQRVQSLLALLSGFQFQTILDDHAIDSGSGYATAVCPGC